MFPSKKIVDLIIGYLHHKLADDFNIADFSIGTTSSVISEIPVLLSLYHSLNFIRSSLWRLFYFLGVLAGYTSCIFDLKIIHLETTVQNQQTFLFATFVSNPLVTTEVPNVTSSNAKVKYRAFVNKHPQIKLNFNIMNPIWEQIKRCTSRRS